MEALYMVTLTTNSPNECLSQQTVQEDATVPQLVLAWLMLHRCSRCLQSMKTNCGRALLFRSCRVSLHFSRCLPRQDSSNPAHARLHRYVSRVKGWHMCRSNNDVLKNDCYGRVDHDEGEAWKISVILKKADLKHRQSCQFSTGRKAAHRLLISQDFETAPWWQQTATTSISPNMLCVGPTRCHVKRKKLV